MPDLKHRYLDAPTFDEYLEGVEKHRDLWHGIYERAAIPRHLLEEAHDVSVDWRMLALSGDWCGDAVNLLPVVARLAEDVPGFELRVLERDENLDIMDAHLTGGRSRSIPIVILLDEEHEERGWWGPRPVELQEWVLTEGRDMESEERYKRIRRWYARDRGATTIRELLDLMKLVAPAGTG